MVIRNFLKIMVSLLWAGLMIAGCNSTDSEDEESESYSRKITMSDGIQAIDLQFGMDTEATAAYDSGLDIEAPPAPPEDSFYAHFKIPGYNLYSDYRPISTEHIVWELEFDSEEDLNLTLEWEIDQNNGIGTFALVDDSENPSIEIDMTTQKRFQPDSSVSNLFIVLE